jgi:FixJ family two-component response regulator
MPEMDGFQLLTALVLSGECIPLIVISGAFFNDFDLLRQARHMGAVAAFEKPLAVPELMEAVRQCAGPPSQTVT